MNKYEVIGVVGEGAYGIVLKCRNKENGELVAIKKFKETEENESVKNSIQREVKVLKILRHPNIVELKDAYKRKGRIYLVFEYVDKNLLEIIEANQQGLDQQSVKKFIFQLLKAIHCCHQHDIVHRDIKPENLLISSSNQLKLCDFGFARSLTAQTQDLTDYVATRWYRAPELLLNQSNYDKGVDMWAIGCLLCELTDGNPLFPGENEMDQLYLIQKMLGPLTPGQQEIFLKNPRFLGMKFPEIGKPETLELKFGQKLSKKAISLAAGLLRMEPSERFTCKQALRHPYFEDLAEAQEFQRDPDLYVDEKRQVKEASRAAASPNIQQNCIRTKNSYKVPTYLGNQFMFHGAYNYKIEEQQQTQQDFESQKMRKASVDRMAQPQNKDAKLGLMNETLNKFNKQDSLFGQPKQSNPQNQQIKIQNVNIIYNANTFNTYQKKQQTTKQSQYYD